MMPMQPASTLAEAVAVTRATEVVDLPRAARAERAIEAALLAVAAIFFSLHFVHLKADFPNYSPWMDWAKYTDEGWYGDAAIRHYQLGHWNVPGDFNAAAALPVWPALELVLFRVTGVSLVAARALTVAVFGMILVCCYGLIRRWSGGPAGELRRRPLAPSIAVLLLSVNPFCYVFSRLAILEPLLILLTLAALLAASSAGVASGLALRVESAGEGEGKRLSRRFAMRVGGLGLLLPLMVLTKTTGVFLFPAIFWLLWASAGHRLRPFLRAAGLACGVGVAAWGGYYLLFVRPRYLIDYRYLFSANAYTGITLATFWSVMHDALFDGGWIGETLFAVALVAVVGAVVSLGFRRNPLVVALLLWIFGYGAFLAYHANLQPRYYLVLAIPLMLLVAIAFDAVVAGAIGAGNREQGTVSRASEWALRMAAVFGAAVLVFAVVSGAWRTISYVRHPEYTWVSAAGQIYDAVEREAAVSGHSRLVMSISGSDLALMTGLPSICDDFGTMTLPERVAKYRPGWFATWNDVEDDKMEALAPWFRLVRVATIPAFDDTDRNVLILYRLDPVSSPGVPGRPGRRRFLSFPRRLRTKVGEQPSPVQLKH
jgi:hypothetical protein